MSNKRITDLTELTTPTTDDVFPVVDIATNTTTKVQLGNLPVPSSVTTALATKQNTLVSGTNIKTVNSNSLLGSGDIAVQETLVSGTNIKTLNNTSLLGSGNITLTANPSGVSGAIQFSDGSAFASDATNFFWDNTNKRLGIGTNAPTNPLTINVTQTSTNGLLINQVGGTSGTHISALALAVSGTVRQSISVTPTSGEVRYYVGSGGFFPTFYSNNAEAMRIDGSLNLGIGTTTVSARTHIKGSGSTSATTSLLVQNSAGTQLFKLDDVGDATMGLNNSNTAKLLFQYPLIGGGIVFGDGLSGSQVYGRVSLDRGSGEMRVGAVSSGGYFLTLYSNGSEAARFDTVQSLGIGTTSINASAKVQIDSTTKGFLPPRMTTTQKNAIASPAAGLVVYDSTTNKLCCYNGSTWNDLF